MQPRPGGGGAIRRDPVGRRRRVNVEASKVPPVVPGAAALARAVTAIGGVLFNECSRRVTWRRLRKDSLARISAQIPVKLAGYFGAVAALCFLL